MTTTAPIKPNYWVDEQDYGHNESCHGLACPFRRFCGRLNNIRLLAGSVCRGHRRKDGLWECTAYAERNDIPPSYPNEEMP